MADEIEILVGKELMANYGIMVLRTGNHYIVSPRATDFESAERKDDFISVMNLVNDYLNEKFSEDYQRCLKNKPLLCGLSNDEEVLLDSFRKLVVRANSLEEKVSSKPGAPNPQVTIDYSGAIPEETSFNDIPF